MVKKITPLMIENIYQRWEEAGEDSLCSDNQRKCHTIIKAVGWGIITINPADHVETPTIKAKEMDYWTSEECHRFLREAEKDRYYQAFLLAIVAGMRQGEILGAEKTDVKFTAKSLSIHQTLEHDGKK